MAYYHTPRLDRRYKPLPTALRGHVAELRAGPTARRPGNPYPGQPYFDTDTGEAVYWNGTEWTDEVGS